MCQQTQEEVMLSRRELITGGAAVHVTGADVAMAQRGSDDDDGRELRSIRDVLDAIRSDHLIASPVVNQIRERQRTFLRLNQRFPQRIDVGIRVWERMQDWHISNLRPLTIQRAADGHWQMDFLMTVLVLKLELQDNEVGMAYDLQ
jgi:hypothetical protein